MSKRILVAGSGGIGRAVALILRELGDLDVDVVLGDAHANVAAEAAAFVGNDSRASGAVEVVDIPMSGNTPELEFVLDDVDIVLDCLPGSQAPRVATWALDHGCHYANLTEYVAETQAILGMTAQAETGFALQCGLAPGFVNVLGVHLFHRFCERFGVETAESLEMRVGALTRNAEAPHYYGFTWSPVGVATEYVEPAIVVRNHKKVEVPSLTEIEQLYVDGRPYEEALTSGGAADVPDALANKIADIDYKTLRYPGHWAWVQDRLAAIGEVPDRIERLQRRMQATIPLVGDDVVVIYAAVEGLDSSGIRRRSDEAFRVFPSEIGGKRLRAIQSTTAAGLAECARMLLTRDIRGPLLQSQLDTRDYLLGPYVSAVVEKPLSLRRA